MIDDCINLWIKSENVIMSYYDELGLSKTASDEEIKKSYRRLAHKYHPDKGGSSEDAAKFKKANEAYQVLSDKQKRAEYDQFGHDNYKRSQQNGGGGGGFSGFDFGEGGSFNFSGFGGGGGLNDIFESFFGQAFLTLQAEVEISVAQAVLGEKISVKVGQENVELNIPAGIVNGAQFQFKGKGQEGRNGQRGDLIITVHVRMPKNISTEERSLYEQLRQLEQTKRRGFWNR